MLRESTTELVDRPVRRREQVTSWAWLDMGGLTVSTKHGAHVRTATLQARYGLYTPYSTRMSPENTHKLMGFYMEVLILGIIYTLVHVHGFCFFNLFPIWRIGFIHVPHTTHGRNPILAASWIGVKRRKFRRVGSAPASRRMDNDSFFCARTAQCSAVSPSESCGRQCMRELPSVRCSHEHYRPVAA